MSTPFDQMPPPPPSAALTGGVPLAPAAPAQQPPEPVRYAVSEERVKRLFEEIDAAREFDDNARRDYAFCRFYARGDSNFEVSVNLIGTYIDIMVAFLYARDPDVACSPSDSVGRRAKAEAKVFAETMQKVLSRCWRDVGLKRAAERWVRSMLTIGVGWLKSGWQERYETDPEIAQRKRDIQENLARIAQLQEELSNGAADDFEARQEELQAQLHGLEGHVEKLVYRGLFVDFVPGEHIQVSVDVPSLIDIEGATWIAHINYIPLDHAKAKWRDAGITDDEWKAAELFHVNKPTSRQERNETPEARTDIDPTMASRYSRGHLPSGVGSSDSKYNCFVQHIELWRGDESLVYDLVRGVKKCLDCGPPNVATTRFYPFFPCALHEVDNERHPQSLVLRSYKLVDEYARTRSGKAQLRRRIKPKMAFDARAHTAQQINKIARGEYGEYIPLKPAVEGATLKDSIWEMQYPRIDPALFDLSEVRSELETMWGIQEALSGTVQVAKTATEAEIQQAGTQARTGAMRDRIEERLTALANYHAEILLQMLSLEDVAEMVGPEAIWPQVDVQDLDLLVKVEIAAGTTGKPNTTAQREAWAATLPLARDLIMQIGQLRMSPPEEVARCLEALLEETFIRAGDDRFDIERILPQAGQPAPLVDPATGMPVMAPPAAGGTLPEQLPPATDPTMPQGDVVAPSELPPRMQ